MIEMKRDQFSDLDSVAIGPDRMIQQSEDGAVVLLVENRKLSQLPGYLVSPRTCGRLQHLNLAFNQLETLADLVHVPQLIHLDASHNRLTTIERVKTMTSLKVLRLHANRLGSV